MRGFPVVAPAWPLLMQAPTVMPTPVVIPVEISFRLNLDLQTATFYDLQREVRREARQALLRALRASLVEVEKALVAEPILCPGCQVPMRSRGRTVRRIVTVFGSLPVRRARYGCATCGTVRRPLDEWIGLAEGTEYTAAVREQVLYLSADLPYERAADVRPALAEVRRRLDAALTAHRLGERTADELATDAYLAFEPLEARLDTAAVGEVERAFLRFRTALRQTPGAREVDAAAAAVRAAVDRAESPSPVDVRWVAGGAAVALLAFLVSRARSGASARRRRSPPAGTGAPSTDPTSPTS